MKRNLKVTISKEAVEELAKHLGQDLDESSELLQSLLSMCSIETIEEQKRRETAERKRRETAKRLIQYYEEDPEAFHRSFGISDISDEDFISFLRKDLENRRAE